MLRTPTAGDKNSANLQIKHHHRDLVLCWRPSRMKRFSKVGALSARFCKLFFASNAMNIMALFNRDACPVRGDTLTVSLGSTRIPVRRNCSQRTSRIRPRTFHALCFTSSRSRPPTLATLSTSLMASRESREIVALIGSGSGIVDGAGSLYKGALSTTERCRGRLNDQLRFSNRVSDGNCSLLLNASCTNLLVNVRVNSAAERLNRIGAVLTRWIFPGTV